MKSAYLLWAYVHMSCDQVNQKNHLFYSVLFEVFLGVQRWKYSVFDKS